MASSRAPFWRQHGAPPPWASPPPFTTGRPKPSSTLIPSTMSTSPNVATSTTASLAGVAGGSATPSTADRVADLGTGAAGGSEPVVGPGAGEGGGVGVVRGVAPPSAPHVSRCNVNDAVWAAANTPHPTPPGGTVSRACRVAGGWRWQAPSPPAGQGRPQIAVIHNVDVQLIGASAGHGRRRFAGRPRYPPQGWTAS